ncbi:autotransporter outer membrane beta-barrel domain-containing protein [Brucella pseudintermedia]|uniref:autotransporter outer membrane beta-barrel domain-containing protein n=1 Tax=Brucella pseudintermedia TaxID=370111 RepID=UPI00158A77A9|nr:autotransporter outer membrane beta-barrel domain-containing protein [Brucella pseudintermedia]
MFKPEVRIGIYAVLAACAGVDTGFAQQPGATPPTDGEMVIINLGQAGLIAEMNSYEDFGTVQSRIGQSRAQIEAFRATGISTGYKDSANVAVVPFDFFYEIPGGVATSFVKFGGVANFNRGNENQTELYARTGRFEVEYLVAPSKDTLFGIGAIVEKTKVDMRHNDGTIEDLGYGIRGDFVQKFDDHWGVAGRAEYLWSKGETRIPLGGGMHYGYDQDWGRFYTQASLVGSFTKDTLSFVPEGWVFHPSIGTIYQNNRFNDVRDTFGGVVNGTVGRHDAYATVSANVRLESMDLRPGNLAPYVEVGLEQEVKNDLNLIVDDPTSLHTVIGASLNIGGGTILHLEYGRHDGLKGERRDQALTLHLGMIF